MPTRAHAELRLLENELDRIGLLLQHDAELPSATALLAGTPIVGSWWGHPLGKQLYASLGEFEHGAGALCLKLVNGKVTYVAARLWPAVLALVEAGATERANHLTRRAKALQKHMHALGSARGDDFAAAGFGSSKEFALAAKELEAAFLAHSARRSGESGALRKAAAESAPAGRAASLIAKR